MVNYEVLPNGYIVKNKPGFKRVTQKEFANYIDNYSDSYGISLGPNVLYYNIKTHETIAIFIPTAHFNYEHYNECCIWYIKE